MADFKELKIEYRDISTLVPFKRNPKTHPEIQVSNIARSIEKFGWRNPVLINADTGEIVAGHGRILAAKKLGITSIPTIDASDMTDEQIDQYRYLDNKLAESPWDVDVLAEDLMSLDFSDFDLEWETGILSDPEQIEVEEDDFNETDDVKETRVKRGDVWQLGDHRLMCGDSTIPEDVERLMGGNKADLFLTDPPYNVALGIGASASESRARHRRTDGLVIANDSMEDSDFRAFLIQCFQNAKENMRTGASFYIWHADNEGYNFRGACRDIGWQVRQTLIWNKNAITLGRQDYQWRHEPCLYGWNDGTHSWYSDRKQSTVIDMNRPTKSELHPTMKPVELFAYQIQNSTQIGEIVMDLFGGSGTTIVACEQTGRRGFLMELDERYADVILSRWEKDTGDSAILLRRVKDSEGQDKENEDAE